ncbi:MAG: hypothetical protein Q4B54_01735 [Coriobacteriales bacterium]|nr:hypothetical protein [Coriobacteriales bacterium]
MDMPALLTVIAVGIPLIATLHVWMSDGNIAERHHSHHDTYMIASSLILTLMFAMIFMGALGALLGWLCSVGVFEARIGVVLIFFDAFLISTFIYWALLRRYKVVTYDDYMEVTPFFGHMERIAYSDISTMEWTPSLIMPNYRNVRVFVGHRRRALLWCGLDLDQILIRINRFDAIESFAGSI